MPDEHHFAADLPAFGLDNPEVVSATSDRPYGLTKGAGLPDDVPPADVAWLGAPSVW